MRIRGRRWTRIRGRRGACPPPPEPPASGKVPVPGKGRRRARAGGSESRGNTMGSSRFFAERPHRISASLRRVPSRCELARACLTAGCVRCAGGTRRDAPRSAAFSPPSPSLSSPWKFRAVAADAGRWEPGGVRGSREEVSNWRLEISGRSDRVPGGDQSSRCRGEIHQPLVYLADGRRKFPCSVSVTAGIFRIAQPPRADELPAGIGIHPQFSQNLAADLFRPFLLI